MKCYSYLINNAFICKALKKVSEDWLPKKMPLKNKKLLKQQFKNIARNTAIKNSK